MGSAIGEGFCARAQESAVQLLYTLDPPTFQDDPTCQTAYTLSQELLDSPFVTQLQQLKRFGQPLIEEAQTCQQRFEARNEWVQGGARILESMKTGGCNSPTPMVSLDLLAEICAWLRRADEFAAPLVHDKVINQMTPVAATLVKMALQKVKSDQWDPLLTVLRNLEGLPGAIIDPIQTELALMSALASARSVWGTVPDKDMSLETLRGICNAHDAAKHLRPELHDIRGWVEEATLEAVTELLLREETLESKQNHEIRLIRDVIVAGTAAFGIMVKQTQCPDTVADEDTVARTNYIEKMFELADTLSPAETTSDAIDECINRCKQCIRLLRQLPHLRRDIVTCHVNDATLHETAIEAHHFVEMSKASVVADTE